MDAMRILMDEHQSLAAIIHAIRHMIGEIEAGRLQPDHKLLEAMVHYLEAYPEKRHHPKEDAFLFGPLRSVTLGQRVFTGVLVGFVFRIAQDLLGPSSLVFGFSPLLAVVVPAGICALAGFFLLRRAA